MLFWVFSFCNILFQLSLVKSHFL